MQYRYHVDIQCKVQLRSSFEFREFFDFFFSKGLKFARIFFLLFLAEKASRNSPRLKKINKFMKKGMEFVTKIQPRFCFCFFAWGRVQEKGVTKTALMSKPKFFCFFPCIYCTRTNNEQTMTKLYIYRPLIPLESIFIGQSINQSIKKDIFQHPSIVSAFILQAVSL